MPHGQIIILPNSLYLKIYSWNICFILWDDFLTFAANSNATLRIIYPLQQQKHFHVNIKKRKILKG